MHRSPSTGVRVVSDDRGCHVVQRFAQFPGGVQRGCRGVWGVGAAPVQRPQRAGIELAGQARPLQEPRVPGEPVDWLGIAGGDRVHQVQREVAGDEVTGLERVLLNQCHL